ncbi:MAG: glycosyltransferase [Planctomycetaceae bacterium]|nr:glycosyltransferase [Planctomycetaceae bacterium]
MRISVIIPTLNESRLVSAAVSSAKQAGADEIIVVDGASSDGTAEVAAALGCQVIHCDPGRSGQQNAGAERASGDVLLFLHADSRLGRDSLDQIRLVLQDDRLVGGAFKHHIEAKGILFRLLELGNAARVHWFSMAYGDQGIFVRRTIFHDIAGFPPVRLMEDVRLMRRLRQQGRIVLLTGPLVTNARRWQQRGVVWQTLQNWLLLTAEWLGVSPDYLATFYPPSGSNSQTDTNGE